MSSKCVGGELELWGREDLETKSVFQAAVFMWIKLLFCKFLVVYYCQRDLSGGSAVFVLYC